MIVVDSSAILAVLLGEQGSERIADSFATPGPLVIGAPSLVESFLVCWGKFGTAGSTKLLDLVAETQIEVQPFGPQEAFLAQQAFERFGRGRNRAKLNFGDCMAYATAKALDAPLLYKGGDFALTDIVAAACAGAARFGANPC